MRRGRGASPAGVCTTHRGCTCALLSTTAISRPDDGTPVETKGPKVLRKFRLICVQLTGWSLSLVLVTLPSPSRAHILLWSQAHLTHLLQPITRQGMQRDVMLDDTAYQKGERGRFQQPSALRRSGRRASPGPKSGKIPPRSTGRILTVSLKAPLSRRSQGAFHRRACDGPPRGP